MKNILQESLISYIREMLPSDYLQIIPENIWKDFGDLETIIVFLVLTVVYIGSRIISFFWRFLQRFCFSGVNDKNLNIREKAILMYYKENQYTSQTLDSGNPDVQNLKNRGFLYQLTWVLKRERFFENLALTEAGAKKLQSEEFQYKISEDFDSYKASNFINSIILFRK